MSFPKQNNKRNVQPVEAVEIVELVELVEPIEIVEGTPYPPPENGTISTLKRTPSEP